MPVAEPSGEYSVVCRVDLSHLFSKIEETKTLSITRPSPDILEKLLAKLASDDSLTRLEAATELGYFQKHGDRVFPALVESFKIDDDNLRQNLMYSMANYPDQIEKQTTFFLKVLANKELPERIREYSAYCLGEHGAISPDVEKALEAAAANKKGGLETYALQSYQRRKKASAIGD